MTAVKGKDLVYRKLHFSWGKISAVLKRNV